ncbi:hypothetical protein OS493_006414 [Desmophyllum pertusum]|uniref:Uncharacterized protein n=1 Tax=Desmophyllum pertusum TaxID=174260 RepID=A0A9X0A5J5_9CNID|nr:hypothetical protein OS493_006414 [Desmophyllum pertusum]
MDVMMMKKTNLEKSVEHYKNEGVKLTDVWNGFYSTCSNCYETTARLVSYCHPIEKVGQMFGFADRYIRKAGRHLLDDEDNEKRNNLHMM